VSFLRSRRNRRKRKPLLGRYRALGSAVALVFMGAALGWMLRSAPARPSTEWAGLGGLPRVEASDWELPELPDVRAALRGRYLRVAQVDVYGLEHISRDEIDALAKLDGQPALVDVDPTAVCERIAAHPRVAGCSCFRVPRRVVIRIEEREAIARIGSTLAALADDGAKFPVLPEEAAGLPSVHGDVHPSLVLLRAARAAGIAIDEVAVRSESDVRFRPAESELWVVTGRWPERALNVWRTVQASEAVHAAGLAEVDLRFEGHVVLRDTPRPRKGVEDGTS
jgi:hypothetical protein